MKYVCIFLIAFFIINFVACTNKEERTLTIRDIEMLWKF